MQDENVSWQTRSFVYDRVKEEYIFDFDLSISSYHPIQRINEDLFFMFDWGSHTVGFLDLSKINSSNN